MTTTINASPSNGLVQTADGSGILKVQSNGVTTNALAWVNYDISSGSSATIRSSYNVSSVTYNSTGVATINFTNALADANYSAVGNHNVPYAGSLGIAFAYDSPNSYSTTALTVTCFNSNSGSSYRANASKVTVAVFGN